MPVQITNFDFAAVLNYICTLVSYPQSTDPAGSIDLKHAQMRAAVVNACAEMLALNEWQDLTTDGTINVVADFAGQKEKAFPLPADFYRFIDQTQWAPSQMWPAGGPVSAQAWKQYIVWSTYPQLSLYWQIRDDQIWFLSPPFPTPQPFTFFYISKAQIIDQDDPTLRKNTINKNGDKFILDAYIIALLGRKKWLEWNSMDSTSATADFNVAFNSRVGADKGAAVLTMGRAPGMPLISAGNVPQTNIGM